MGLDDVVNRRILGSHKWLENDPDVIPLSLADMDFRSPAPVAEALRSYVDERGFGYYRGLGGSLSVDYLELADLVVNRMKCRYNWQITAEDVCVVPGVVAGLRTVCQWFSENANPLRRGVVVQSPVYHAILTAPENAHLDRVDIPLLYGADRQYSVNWESFRSQVVQRAGLFLLSNPHNPVGRVFARVELEQMAYICLRSKVTVCSDEIHSDLLFDGREHIPIAALDPEIAESAITLISPSKTFNLSGLQCAFAIIQNPELRAGFLAASRKLAPWVNAMGLIAAEAAYRNCQSWLDQLLRYLQSNRDFLVDFVRRHLQPVRITKPQGTYLAWLDCRELAVADPYTFFKENARVALSDGQAFGSEGKGFLRLNFACPRQILGEALSRLNVSLNSKESLTVHF